MRENKELRKDTPRLFVRRRRCVFVESYPMWIIFLTNNSLHIHGNMALQKVLSRQIVSRNLFN